MGATHNSVCPVSHLGARSASRCMGETRTRPPVPHLRALGERFALSRYGQDTHVSAPSRSCTCVRGPLRCPLRGSVPHFKACRRGAAERLAMYGRVTHVSALYGPARACAERFAVFALYERDTHVSALSRTCVRGTLRAVPWHGRGPHVSALSRTCVRQAPRAVWARHARIRPIPHPSAKSASRCMGETRTCLPCPALACGERFAPYE